MSVSIGRAALNDLYGLSVRGDRVSFRTEIDFGSVDQMKAVRQQLAGLVANRDEEVVPFVWSEDSSLDGFYRVIGVDVPSSDMALSTGWISDVQIDLEQLPGFSTPWFEVTAQSVVVTNGLSVTSPSSVLGVHQAPTGAYQYEMGASIRLATPDVVTCDTGDEIWRYKRSAPQALTAYRYRVAPADFYVGGCAVEVKFGSSWFPVVGRQVALPAGTVWRITNGLVRLTSVDGASDGTIEAWGGSAWESQAIAYTTVPTFGILSGLCVEGGAIGSEGPLSILRNSPETVVVTCTGTESASTFALNRGSYHVVMVPTFYSPGGTGGFSGRGLGFATAVGGTSFTGGVYRSSADANGNGCAFMSPSSSVVKATAQAGVAGVSGTPIAVGVTLDAATSGAAQTVRDEFLGAVAWRQRVVVT